MDTLPSPYYDMLIVNTFMEFGDLMYSVGKIEDGIKRERIVDTGASMREKKELFSMSMFKQCLERKERATKYHMRHGKSLSRIILVHQGMPKSPWPIFIRPKGSHENRIKSLIQVVPGEIGRASCRERVCT